MPQFCKVLISRHASVTIAQLNGIYLLKIPPRKFVLGSEFLTKVDSIHHTQDAPKVPASQYRACDVE